VDALRRAQGHIDAHRYADAIGPLTEAAHLAPTHPAVLHQVGVACLFARRVPEAIRWLRESIALNRNVARVHFDLGLALAQAGDDDGALAAHRSAVTLDPKLAEAHGRVGDLLRRKNHPEEASAAYEQAFHAAPGTAYGLLCRAKALAAQNRSRESEEQLQQVIARPASSGDDLRWQAEAQLVLGHLLIEEGRFDESRASFERSLELVPGQAAAFHGLVTTKKMTEEDRPIVERIMKRLQAPDLGERQRGLLHFAAGKALDDLKDYGAAMEQFDAANRIRRSITGFDRNDFERTVGLLIARFTRDFFAHNAGLGQDDETPVLVLGMPRSGTTLIERVISSHPRVGGGGELSFWSEQAPKWVHAELRELGAAADGIRSAYRRVLHGIAPDALRVTDKMPFNFLWLGVVHALLPNARVIHCRRNPIDTCLSVYTTHFTQNWGFASDKGDLAAYYRQYLRLMEHWRTVLPPDRFFEVDYEEATAAPEGVAHRLIASCGLEWDPACLRPDQNADTVRTASKWQARQPIYRSSVERWRNYEPWLGELRGLLPVPQCPTA
jgi:tetratricopeptide (TPR) repeat protein